MTYCSNCGCGTCPTCGTYIQGNIPNPTSTVGSVVCSCFCHNTLNTAMGAINLNGMI